MCIVRRFIFPPLAVIDKGCGSVCLVFLFTLFGWLPRTILAFLICIREKNYFLQQKP
ncbi:YqaE/Pmp3 family membrane protein [bacterium]|nr:YqaE/Pmp3 family membrane protein [bacterium]